MSSKKNLILGNPLKNINLNNNVVNEIKKNNNSYLTKKLTDFLRIKLKESLSELSNENLLSILENIKEVDLSSKINTNLRQFLDDLAHDNINDKKTLDSV